MTHTLGGGDDLVGQSLGHRLVASERRLSGSLADQINSLVDSSQWRHIDGLSSNGTSGSNSRGVLSGSGLDDGLEENLKRVLSGQQVDDLESLLEDSHGHLLFTVLSVVTNHDLIDKSLGDWALNLLESFLLIFTSGVWHVHLSLGRLH